MTLARTIPGDRGLAPLNVFECARCGVYLSEAGGEPRAVADNGPSRA